MTDKAALLIINNDPAGCETIENLLSEEDYILSFVESPDEALTTLEHTSLELRAVLFTWATAGDAFFSFLERVQGIERWDGLPIILQTRDDDAIDMPRVIEAGVHYFLRSPLDKNMLISILRTSVEQFEKYRTLTSPEQDANTVYLEQLLNKMIRKTIELDEKLKLSEDQRSELQEEVRETKETVDKAVTLKENTLAPFFTKAEMAFQTIQDGERIAAWLGQFSTNPRVTTLGFEELFTNAVEHGNLSITYDEKSDLLSSHEWLDEIKRRYALPENQNKRVAVTLEKVDDCYDVRIVDCGEGFDFERYFDLTPDRIYDLHGRGIYMAKNMYLETVEYVKPGNTVHVRFKAGEGEENENAS